MNNSSPIKPPPPSSWNPRQQLQKLSSLWYEYPSQFWTLVMAMFVDRLGGAMMFPFFSLYVTSKFGVGMTEVGLIFGIYSIAGLFSSLMGGALADRIGRKGIIIFGLIMSALSALFMGFVNEFGLFIGAAALVGLLAEVGMPAHQAMVADLLPEPQRAQGYGILRVVANLAVVIGPLVGGVLAMRSYLLIFLADAVTSSITALIIYFAIRETRKQPEEHETQETMTETFKGYFHVLRDSVFTWFLLATMLSVVVYMQMNSTLAVFLRDVHSVTPKMFGYILSLNAAIVVLFQFPVTRWVSKYRPMMVMVVGTLFYSFGFLLYGFIAVYPLFMLAMVIITIGEILVSPVSQSIVCSLAPEAMRGRYMAAFGFSWVLPTAVGPLLAGLVMDRLDPHWVWYAAGLIGFTSAVMYYIIERKSGAARWAVIEQRLTIMEKLEEGKVTAEEAARLLEHVEESQWQRLYTQEDVKKQNRLKITVPTPENCAPLSELYLPVGLMNTILNTDCRLSSDLNEGFDGIKIRALIAKIQASSPGASVESDSGRVEISSD